MLKVVISTWWNSSVSFYKEEKNLFFFFKLLGSLDMGFNSPHPCSMMLLTKGQCFLQTFVSCFPSDLIQVGENSAVGKKGRLEGQRA